MPGLYSYIATALVAASLASAGAWRVQEWRWQANNAAEQDKRDESERDARKLRDDESERQRNTNDNLAGEHAKALAGLSNQLGDARAHISSLSKRRCLDAGTVSMLNNIGKPAAAGLGLRAAAGNATSSAGALAGSGDNTGHGNAPTGEHRADVYASEQDAAKQIAICRAGYAKVSDQLNRILDIEDGRVLQR